jgi:hypothetical protein
MIPAGTYVCAVSGANIAYKSGKGRFLGLDMLVMNFIVTEGPMATRSFKGDVPLQGELSWLSRKWIKACLPNYGGGEFDTQDLIGCKLDITVEPQYRQDGTPSLFPRIREIAYHVDGQAGGSLADAMKTGELDGNGEPLPF